MSIAMMSPRGGCEVMFTGGCDAACMVQRMMWLRRDVMTITNIYRSNTTFFKSVFQCVFAVSAAENIPAMA